MPLLVQTFRSLGLPAQVREHVRLTEIDKALNFIRTTTTKPGLAVSAQLAAEIYEKGIKVTDKEMRLLNLAKHETLGRWNYTLHPTQIGI